jgi:DNA-binding CsgD family transcriptional regulator
MTGNPAWLALADRCRALVADEPDQAAEHFRSALRQHQLARATFERARTQLLYGQELRRARRRGEAREQLRAAYDTFTSFNVEPLAELAAAELRAAGTRVQSRAGAQTTSSHQSMAMADAAPPGPMADPACGPAAVLTAQQLQIATLVAGGATNREIAVALFISTRTVDYHMRNILARLGLRSRVDLANLLTSGTTSQTPAARPDGAHTEAAATTVGRRSAHTPVSRR